MHALPKPRVLPAQSRPEITSESPTERHGGNRWIQFPQRLSRFHRIALSCAALLISLSHEAPAQTLTVADSVQSYSSLANTAVTVSGKSQLHITSSSNPIPGSTINLTSNDAWVWFDAIRPATVNSTYLGQIKVNGVTAVHGTNVRVVQYGMGTVVTPFTNSIQPLETFTDPGFGGASKKYSLYTYYDSTADLGVMYDNISSFKLKRGYMATFATNTNGTGTSKVFIAQDHDVNVGVMPSGLDNSVSFVRVFPWRWVSKKGSCDVSPDVLNAAWYYNWNNDQNSALNWEYVPIRQQRYWPGLPSNKTSVTHLSGYNEPDNSIEDSYQSLDSGSRDTAVAAWDDLLSTGLRVGSPACTDGGKWWLFDFMDKANAAGKRVDYITIHYYRCGQSAAQLKSFLQEIWDRYHKPIWLTEFNNGANWTGCGDPTTEQNADVIGSWINEMDNTSWIERYAVYSNVEWQRNMTWDASWSGANGLTPAGAVYRDNSSPIGYQQEDYPLAVKRRVARLPLDGDTHDVSGYDNGGVSYGTPTYVAGHSGQALQFDGSNLHVKLPMALGGSGAFTFAAWVYWNGGADNQRIFDFGNDTSQFFYLTPGSGGQMRFGLRNGSGTTGNVSVAALPTGTWQHVAVTAQGSTAKIYLNGVQQAQGTFADPALSGTLVNYLGKSQWPADPLFNGRLDDVVIADSVLSDSQIAGLISGTPPPFVAHWKGDVDGNWNTENSGNTNWATDSTGTTDVGQLPGSSTELVFSANGAANASNTTLGADQAVLGITFASFSPVVIGGANHLAIGSSGIDLSEGAGTAAITTTGELRLDAAQSWSLNSTNALTVGSSIAGGGTLNVFGTGRLTLSGSNTMTGDINVSGGVSVSVPSVTDALGSAATVRMGGGGATGTLVYTGTGETTARVLTFNGGFGTPGMVLDQSGTGLLEFTANTASNASVSKTLTLQGSTTGTGQISGIIANGASTTSLVKNGTGKWILTGANSFTGGTSLIQGTLAIGHNTALGTGTLDLRGGAIQSSDATARTLANAISLSADTVFGGTGNMLFTGATNAGSLAKTFTVNNPRTEFSGAISGGGARTKAGPGTLVFSGANTYTGATTVSAGTLAVNGSLAAASTVTVSNNATLTGTGTVSGPITFSSGSRLGWSLASNTTTAGKLTAGTVSVTSGAALNIILNEAGSTTDFTNPFWSTSHTWTVMSCSSMSGTFSLGSVSADSAGNPLAAYGTFHLQQTSTAVKLIFAPIGQQPPPTPTGFTVSVTPGAVLLSWAAAAGADSYNVLRSSTSGGPYEIVATDITGTFYNDKSVANGTTYHYVIESANLSGASVPTQEAAATPHLPSVIDKAYNAEDLNLPGSWAGGITPGASDTARWTSLSGPNSVLLGSNAFWNQIVVSATGGPVAIGAGNTLTLGTGGIDMSAASQNLGIESGITLVSGSQNWNVASGRTLTLTTGAFSRPAGATLGFPGPGAVAASMPGLANEGGTSILGPWATTGSGTSQSFATLSGGNIVAYTSGTNVSSASLPNPGTTDDNYNLTTASTTTYGAATRKCNTIRNTAGATTLTFGNSASQINLVSNGIMNAGTGSLTVTHGGSHAASGIMIGPNNARDLIVHAAAGNVSLGRIVDHTTGTSSVTVVASGANSVTLTTAGTFTGGVRLNSGTLLAGNATSLGTGTFSLNGGTFGTTAALTLANAITVNDTATIGHAAQVNTITFSGPLSGNGTLKNGLVTSINTDVNFTGNLSAFTGTLDYTCQAGNTTHRWRVGATGSTADLSKASLVLRIGDVTNTSVFGKNFGFKDGITNCVLKLGALSGDGVFQASFNNSGPNTLEVGHLGNDTTFSGVLAGGTANTNMNLTKVGAGTLTLSGSNPYTGTTTISAGTLMLNGALTGNSAVTVGSGGTLAGTGTSSGPVAVASGGALTPGNGGSGQLTITAGLTLNDGSSLNASLGTTTGRVAIGGGLTAPGITSVNVNALPGFGTGTYTLMTGVGSVDVSHFQLGSAPPGYLYSLGITGGTLSLTVTAPPSAPAGLTATGALNAVALSWSAAPGAETYNVKRSETPGGPYETIAEGLGTTIHQDTGLVAGTTYYYVVSATNIAGEGADSAEASTIALTPGDAWRQENFGSTASTGDAAFESDPDGDGLENLLEYALGADPNSADPTAAPQLTAPHDRLTISFNRNTAATDLTISVVGADSPAGPWTVLARSAGGAAFTDDIDGTPTGAVVSETGTGGVRTVTVSDTVLMTNPAHPRRFLKLEVQR